MPKRITYVTVVGLLSLFALATFFLGLGISQAVAKGTPFGLAVAAVAMYLIITFIIIHTRLEDPDASNVSSDYPYDDPTVHPHFKDWEKP